MPGKGSRCPKIPTTCCGNALFFSGKWGSAFQIPFRRKSNKLEFLHAGPAYAQLGNTYAEIYPKFPKILLYPTILYIPTSGPTYSNTLPYFTVLSLPPHIFRRKPHDFSCFSRKKTHLPGFTKKIQNTLITHIIEKIYHILSIIFQIFPLFSFPCSRAMYPVLRGGAINHLWPHARTDFFHA